MGYFVQNSIVESTPEYSRSGATATSLIYDREGNRKYLTVSERRAFLEAARRKPPEVYTFCLALAYTGARISEALALTPSRIDVEARVIIFESLKKRRRGMFRAVPVPTELLAELERVHVIETGRRDLRRGKERIWPWCRTTAWTLVKECMAAGGIHGSQGTPKGLRHAFAVSALQAGVPINLVRKWLGHARLSTTEIYADAIGEEERHIAGRFWDDF